MKITTEQLNLFKKNFNLHDRFGNEEIKALKYIHWSKLLGQHLIGFVLTEGSTEIGLKNNMLIVGGQFVRPDKEELDIINSFLSDNKDSIEITDF